jgi:hypothetical protein
MAEEPLVRVATARNQAEAELIQGLLEQEGVPSLLRRTRGFDVPDFLASGPRDVLVHRSNALAAREALGTPAALPEPAPSSVPAWVRPLAAALLVLVLAGLAAAVLAATG